MKHKVIPIKVTAQDGTVSNHSLTIYRQSEATTIKEIKVEIVDASGNVLNTYTAYQKNPSDTQNYEVVIPIKDVANINIITTPMIEMSQR